MGGNHHLPKHGSTKAATPDQCGPTPGACPVPVVPYLQGDLVELCEREDGLLHHVDALVLQQHVQVGHKAQQQLIVTLTAEDNNSMEDQS